MKRQIALLAAIVAGALVAAACVALGPVGVVASVLPPCATEDATNCHWDASRVGNGDGVSFVDIGGAVHYLGGES